MKYLAILTLAVAALSLGACAKHDSGMSSTSTHSASTGYTK